MSAYTPEDLNEALRTLESARAKCEKALPNQREGTPQHTLLTRRIKALEIAVTLIRRELDAGG